MEALTSCLPVSLSGERLWISPSPWLSADESVLSRSSKMDTFDGTKSMEKNTSADAHHCAYNMYINVHIPCASMCTCHVHQCAHAMCINVHMPCAPMCT